MSFRDVPQTTQRNRFAIIFCCMLSNTEKLRSTGEISKIYYLRVYRSIRIPRTVYERVIRKLSVHSKKDLTKGTKLLNRGQM